MLLTRRQLLTAIPAFAAALMLPAGMTGAAEMLADGPKKRLVVGSLNRACVFDIAAYRMLAAVELPFYAHSFVQHPGRPERVWAIQRHNYDLSPDRISHHKKLYTPYISRAVELDTQSGEITCRIDAAEGTVFNGHGLFLPGADDVLFISGIQKSEGHGFLTAYDTHTGKKIEEYKVTQAGTHECRLGSDGTVFIATAGLQAIAGRFKADGTPENKRVAPGGIVQFDLRQGKEVSFTPCGDDDQLIGHFCLLQNGVILAAAVQVDYDKKIPPMIFMGKIGENALTALPYNDRVPALAHGGELFSVIADEGKRIGAVCSQAHNSVILVDLERRTLARQVGFDNPWGIVLDSERQEFLASGELYMGSIDEQFRQMRKKTLGGNSIQQHFSSGHSLLL